MADDFWEGAELISDYSRAQAIEDGVLVDLTDARDANDNRISPFKFPVAMTAAAFAEAISAGGKWEDDGDGETLVLPGCQDFAGRCWDVFWMLKCGIGRASDPSQVNFQVSVIVDGARHRKSVKLKALCGPGDKAEPVLTIMLPEED
jgi:hypothetical protein